MTDVNLPAIIKNTLPVLDDLTAALGIPRSILASDEEIGSAWSSLPSVLNKIPAELRTEQLAKMCIAVASGLFDSALNYVWNCSIVELREKVKRFGLNVVSQITGKPSFDEQVLIDLKDADLLNLCLKLNLITEDGFYFLDQCRDIRNNFSAAHPGVGNIDNHEFIAFTNRCAKYALNNEYNPVGVDLAGFLIAIKAGKFTPEQTNQWVLRIAKTHEAQQGLIFGTMHGIYCDPASHEEARVNALAITSEFAKGFSPKAKSDFINRHHDYIAKGDEKRHKASQQFFEKLQILDLLDAHEVHSLISNAAKKLMAVHQSYDNFYNEPPFAERLRTLSEQGATPDTVKQELVETIVTCAVGNQYGVSHLATPHYRKLIRGFSPAEVEIMLSLPSEKNILARRMKFSSPCNERYKEFVNLIDPSTVPSKVASAYAEYLK
ncbi:hypothetical protein [Phyllobacterium endophyticum]|uniref:Uncharacterized protein n=1 Tax=Phyllobacterium endophyticum TaxID=1149773 RepID=A0A2P7AZT6_9HYPH|nr:hypothetical protein [Phyllobacterium endophyticum]MBB3235649.1 hypothetical protein [Phyllobacterium endophyticum]PSH59728.1 hypothetical protein CU100_02890 [Phyllobacterium endophyticum]TYR41876.1 hypothetical protein FY050_11515 [Phyllobacterium endophyticum]